MRVIAAMFDSRAHAEDAIDRLVAARCPRDAVTFLPEAELSEVASVGAYDWRADRWGLWRGLATFEVISHPDRYALAEAMNRGAAVLLVAARNDDEAERLGTVLVEAGAVDLDEREKEWRATGWAGYDGDAAPATERPRAPSPKRFRLY